MSRSSYHPGSHGFKTVDVESRLNQPLMGRDHLRAASYQLLIGNTEFYASREEALIRSILCWNPSGFVLTGCSHRRTLASLLGISRDCYLIGSRGVTQQQGFMWASNASQEKAPEACYFVFRWLMKPYVAST